MRLFLTESARDNFLAQYIPLFTEKGINATVSILKKALLMRLTEQGGLRNLSLGSNFYLAGAVKYYFNGDLTKNKELGIFTDSPDEWDEEVCKRLNALILILRNIHVDSVGTKLEQPEDFGELPINKLLRKYGAKINAALGIKKGTNGGGEKKRDDGLNRDEHVGNGYTFDIIYNFEQAQKYYNYTAPGSWCITYGQQYYNGYVRNQNIHYVIFRQDGFEKVPRVAEKDKWKPGRRPQDTYGNSLIAMNQSNVNGEPVFITSRWNHGHSSDDSHCEADHAYTKQEFFDITGMNDNDLQRIFQIWKKDRTSVARGPVSDEVKQARKEKENAVRTFKYMQMRINGGESVESVFTHRPEGSTESVLRLKTVIGKEGLKANKTVCYGIVNIEGIDWLALVDKGRILFESVVRYEDYRGSITRGWHRFIDYTDSKTIDDNGNEEPTSAYRRIKNAIILNFQAPNDYKLAYSMIYNLRTHQFVEIEGVTRFKYVTSALSDSHGRDDEFDKFKGLFYEVKMTANQIALVRCSDNTPLKLPNGACWFENLKYFNKPNHWGRDVRSSFIYDNVPIIEIEYESVSRTYFFYSPLENKFIDIDPRKDSGFEDVEGFMEKPYHLSDRDSNNLKPLGEGFYSIEIGDIWRDGAIAIYDRNHNQLKLGKYKLFKRFTPLSKDLVAFEPYGIDSGDGRRNEKKSLNKKIAIYDRTNECILYVPKNMAKDTTITPGDGWISEVEITRETGYSWQDVKDPKFIYYRLPYRNVWGANDRYNNSNYYIIDIASRSILWNPYTNSYHFYIYEKSNPVDNVVKLYTYKDVEGSDQTDATGSIRTVNLNSLVDSGKSIPLEVGQSLSLSYADGEDDGEVTEPSMNESMSITRQDIIRMVNESVRRILGIL